MNIHAENRDGAKLGKKWEKPKIVVPTALKMQSILSLQAWKNCNSAMINPRNTV